MQNTGDETKKVEEQRTKSRMQNQKKVWWLGRLAQEGSPDPGKTHQIRRCMGTGGKRWKERNRKASRKRRNRLLHEEALAGGGFGFAGRRLFLYLAETKFKYSGY